MLQRKRALLERHEEQLAAQAAADAQQPTTFIPDQQQQQQGNQTQDGNTAPPALQTPLASVSSLADLTAASVQIPQAAAAAAAPTSTEYGLFQPPYKKMARLGSVVSLASPTPQGPLAPLASPSLPPGPLATPTSASYPGNMDVMFFPTATGAQQLGMGRSQSTDAVTAATAAGFAPPQSQTAQQQQHAVPLSPADQPSAPSQHRPGQQLSATKTEADDDQHQNLLHQIEVLMYSLDIVHRLLMSTTEDLQLLAGQQVRPIPSSASASTGEAVPSTSGAQTTASFLGRLIQAYQLSDEALQYSSLAGPLSQQIDAGIKSRCDHLLELFREVLAAAPSSNPAASLLVDGSAANALQVELRQRTTDLEHLKTVVDVSRRRIKELERRAEKIKKGSGTSEDDGSTMSSKARIFLDEANRKIAELESEMSQMQAVLRVRDEERQKADTESVRWRQKYMVLQQEMLRNKSAASTEEDLKSAAGSLSQVAAAAASGVVATAGIPEPLLAADNIRLTAELQALSKDMATKMAEKQREGEEQRTLVQRDVQILQQTVADLQQRLRTVDADRYDLKTELDAIKREIQSDDSKKRGALFRDLIASLREQISQSESRRARVESQLAELMSRRTGPGCSSGAAEGSQQAASGSVVTSLEQDLQMEREQSAALMSEMESIVKAFEESQAQNVRLALQLSEADDGQRILMSERMRMRKLQEELVRSREVEAERAEKALGLVKQMEGLDSERERLTAELKAKNMALDGELQKMRETLDLHRRASMQCYTQVEADRKSLAAERERLANGRAVLDELEQRLRDESSQLRRQKEVCAVLEARNTTLESEVKEARKTALSSSNSDSARTIAALSELVYCLQCRERIKDCMLVRCCHAFCRKCVNVNITNRNRKCPRCKTPFGEKDVKDLFL